MAPIRPRDLLTDGLLARLGGTSPYASALAGQVLAGSAPAGSAAAGSVPVPGSGSTGTGPDIAAVLRRDIARLADIDYLKVALPAGPLPASTCPASALAYGEVPPSRASSPSVSRSRGLIGAMDLLPPYGFARIFMRSHR